MVAVSYVVFVPILKISVQVCMRKFYDVVQYCATKGVILKFRVSAIHGNGVDQLSLCLLEFKFASTYGTILTYLLNRKFSNYLVRYD